MMAIIVFLPMITFFIFQNFKLTKTIIAMATVIVMAILFSFQNNHGGSLTDYDAYYSLWIFISNGGNNPNYIGFETDYGFMCLMWVLSRFTNNFEIFCLTIFILSLVFIIFGFYKLSQILRIKFSLVLPTIYIVYPFVYDLTQMRFFLAYSITFCAICILLNNNNKNNSTKLLFVCLIMMATSFHKASIVYIIFLLFNNKGYWLLFRKMLPILIILFFILRNQIVTLPIVSNLLDGKEQYLILSKGSSTASAIFIGASLFYYVIITKYVLQQFLKNHPDLVKFNINILVNMNTAMLIIVPFLFQNLDVERIFRPFYLLDSIIIFSSLPYFKSNLMRLSIVLPILVIQVVHFIRLDGFIEQMINNVTYVLF